MDLPINPVKVLLVSIPSSYHINSTTQLGVIYSLAEVVLNPAVHVTNENKKNAGTNTDTLGTSLFIVSTLTVNHQLKFFGCSHPVNFKQSIHQIHVSLSYRQGCCVGP